MNGVRGILLILPSCPFVSEEVDHGAQGRRVKDDGKPCGDERGEGGYRSAHEDSALTNRVQCGNVLVLWSRQGICTAPPSALREEDR